MEPHVNNTYNPEPSKYYHYKGKDNLSLDFKNESFEYNDINLFAYTVNVEKKCPFQQILLAKSTINSELIFPKIPIFNNFNNLELIDYAKSCLFGFLMLENYEEFHNLIIFDGFYECNNNLFLFFDLTKNKPDIYDVYRNSDLRFSLVNEITNNEHVCNIKINETVNQIFIENIEFCFLVDERNNYYELPVVCFSLQPENRLNYTYIFGQIKECKNSMLGPYYYFKDYYKLIEESSDFDSKMGLVRFAIFTGNVKYIENYPTDKIDDSEIKKQRLDDDTLNQKLERLTIRISDHDGKWADNYDSIYLGNVELDDGTFLNKQMYVVKEYEQQFPLSFHYLNKNSLNEKMIV